MTRYGTSERWGRAGSRVLMQSIGVIDAQCLRARGHEISVQHPQLVQAGVPLSFTGTIGTKVHR